MKSSLIAWLAPLWIACGAPCHPPGESDNTLRVTVVDAAGAPITRASFAVDGTPTPFICSDDESAGGQSCPSGRWHQGFVGAAALGVTAPGFGSSTVSVDAGTQAICGQGFAAHAVTVTVQLARD